MCPFLSKSTIIAIRFDLSSSSNFEFVHPFLFLICCLICIFFSCFEQLFLCFTQIGGGSYR